MLTKINWYIKYFGFIKVPLIFYVNPKIIRLDSEKIEVRIKLNRRTKNHLGSMYFGALSIGADITAGFLAMRLIQNSNENLKLIFKDFKADFLKRPEGDVHFICKQIQEVKALVNQAIELNQRVFLPVEVYAIVPSLSDDIVASFTLTLSLKKYSSMTGHV